MFASSNGVVNVDAPSKKAATKPKTRSSEFHWKDYPSAPKWLEERTIYVTKHGSTAYGTSTPESDLDVRGIAIAPMRYYTGFVDNFAQATMTEPCDVVIFDIRKFFFLAVEANPNALEIIFTEKEDHLHCNEYGRAILNVRDAFLSKRAKHSLSGYAFGQLKRINTHRRWLLDPPKAPPVRSEFGLPERTIIPKDQLAAATASVDKQLARWNFTDLDDLDPSTRLVLQASMADLLAEIKVSSEDLPSAAARFLGFSDNFIELLDKERKYLNKKKDWASFLKWQSDRNPERAALEAKHQMDTKHAAHLVRLFRTCRDLFETGKYVVRRSDAEELKAIRNGAWTYEQLIDFAAKEDASLSELAKACTLIPEKPNRKLLDDVCTNLILHFGESKIGSAYGTPSGRA
jgi:predicted nucleotidyltransferase